MVKQKVFSSLLWRSEVSELQSLLQERKYFKYQTVKNSNFTCQITKLLYSKISLVTLSDDRDTNSQDSQKQSRIETGIYKDQLLRQTKVYSVQPVEWPGSRKWPHPEIIYAEYKLDSTGYLKEKKDTKLGEMGNKYNPNTLYKTPKELIKIFHWKYIMSTILTSTRALNWNIAGVACRNSFNLERILPNPNKTNKREAEFEKLCKHGREYCTTFRSVWRCMWNWVNLEKTMF